jgi:hypothetical protein
MLTKRAHILFDQNTWKQLETSAKKEKASIGKVIRAVIHRHYALEEEQKRTAKAIDEILRIRPKPFKGKIDYKALINEGRRF